MKRKTRFTAEEKAAILEVVAVAKRRTGWPLRRILRRLGLPRARYHDWKGRAKRGRLEDLQWAGLCYRAILPEEKEAVIRYALEHPKDGYRPYLRGVPPRPVHDPILSRDGVSGDSGAVQCPPGVVTVRLSSRGACIPNLGSGPSFVSIVVWSGGVKVLFPLRRTLRFVASPSAPIRLRSFSAVASRLTPYSHVRPSAVVRWTVRSVAVWLP